MTARQKDFLASVGVGLLSMVLFVLLMGTVVLWGQSAGEKVRSKLTSGQAQETVADEDDKESPSQ